MDILNNIKTNPETWKITFQNQDSIVFAWGDYRFTRLSDRFNCKMMLNSKKNKFSASWQENDSDAAEAYDSLVYAHLR